VNIRSFVESNQAAQPFRFARRAVGEFRVGMHAWHRRICPRSMTRFPRRDDPAFSIGRAAGDIRSFKNLVVVGLPVKAPGAFEHDAILHPQIAQGVLRAVRQPELHAHRVCGWRDSRAKGNAVGQPTLDVKPAVGTPIPFEPLEIELLLRPNGWNVGVGEISRQPHSSPRPTA